MNEVKRHVVTAEESGMRLDRWFKRRFPHLTQGAVEKMCRTGQVRVDGGRAKASDRVAPGPEHRGELHRTEVGEVRVIDEISGHGGRRVHDEEADGRGHGQGGVSLNCGVRASPALR